MDTDKVLHGPFDIKTHKETFTNYLEVCIGPTGIICYAVPSHQLFLTHVLMTIQNKTKEEIFDSIPYERYGDVHEWLCEQTNCIMVWNDRYVGEINKKQYNALKKLKLHGLYHGPLGKITK